MSDKLTAREKFNNDVMAIEELILSAGYDTTEGDIILRLTNNVSTDGAKLSHVFNYLLGKTLNHYIKERRLMAAYKHIVNSQEKNLDTILSLSGYDNEQSFDKAYRSKFNKTLGETIGSKNMELYIPPVTWDDLSSDKTEEQVDKILDEKSENSSSEMAEIWELQNLATIYDTDEQRAAIAYSVHNKYGISLNTAFKYTNDYITNLLRIDKARRIKDGEQIKRSILREEYLFYYCLRYSLKVCESFYDLTSEDGNTRALTRHVDIEFFKNYAEYENSGFAGNYQKYLDYCGLFKIFGGSGTIADFEIKYDAFLKLNGQESVSALTFNKFCGLYDNFKALNITNDYALFYEAYTLYYKIDWPVAFENFFVVYKAYDELNLQDVEFKTFYDLYPIYEDGTLRNAEFIKLTKLYNEWVKYKGPEDDNSSFIAMFYSFIEKSSCKSISIFGKTISGYAHNNLGMSYPTYLNFYFDTGVSDPIELAETYLEYLHIFQCGNINDFLNKRQEYNSFSSKYGHSNRELSGFRAFLDMWSAVSEHMDYKQSAYIYYSYIYSLKDLTERNRIYQYESRAEDLDMTFDEYTKYYQMYKSLGGNRSAAEFSSAIETLMSLDVINYLKKEHPYIDPAPALIEKHSTIAKENDMEFLVKICDTYNKDYSAFYGIDSNEEFFAYTCYTDIYKPKENYTNTIPPKQLFPFDIVSYNIESFLSNCGYPVVYDSDYEDYEYEEDEHYMQRYDPDLDEWVDIY